ncbi:GlxA family transcriptional regulator [Terasakiella sp. A23]|uniref:GlxA family transcriptional regulator n=1 Tax=Terasakiella sp. FCG-A23 TaxID=3080561 RepID=UPI0029546B5A|nr:GlxA family transcriptional regulator [Terasakiella sp. A23]MDV7338545.1 GlxA family transcriptional regulator [Terasakiella sp. A23]
MKQESRHIVIAVPPKAQPLDVSGPLAAFREAYRQSDKKIRYEVSLLSIDGSDFIEIEGMTVKADLTLETLDRPIDTFLIAGTHAYQQAFEHSTFTDWLKENTPNIRRYGSVCTGAFFLGEAGLLDGRKATTHWQQADELKERYPKADIDRDAIFIQDGALCTSAGITAGIDLALKLIEDDYGRDLALKIARRLVVFLRRPGGQSQYSVHLQAQVANEGPIQTAQQWILDNLESDLCLPVLAKKSAMSVRNFSRTFKKETGHTPSEFIEQARIDAAKRLLEDGDMALQRIASHCGFTNVDMMRRTFIRRIGIKPTDYRNRFQS